MTTAPDWTTYLRARTAPPVAEEDDGPSPYASNPVAWVKDRLGEHLWSKQTEIARSVARNRYTAVKSCHDVGKTFVAACLVAWWLDTHPPGEAFVVTTAPTAPQVEAILWREIGKAHRKGGLSGYITGGAVPAWKLDVGGEIVAYGRKPADYDQAAFQGIHARYVLVVIDEACGVPRSLYDAVDALATNEHARVLAIGNPDDPSSHFETVCKPGSGWNAIRIDGLATPNFTAQALATHPELADLFEREGLQPVEEHLPERLRELLLSPLWVLERMHRWGTDSPLWQAKVRGEFPDVSIDTLIPAGLISAAQLRDLPDEGRSSLAVDVARFGTDRTVITLARGARARVVGSYAKQATTETTGRVIAHARATGVTELRVDGVGVGGGVVDQLAEQGWRVLDMQAGAGAVDSERFLNARAEWYWGLRERFEAGDIDIDPDDDDLAAQLGSLKYKFTSRGQVQIESKDDMRKRGLPSPDRADTLMMAYAAEPPMTELVLDEDDLDPELAGFTIGPSY